MKVNLTNSISNNETKRDIKILLLLPPFWAPLITPLGISCLKGHLVSNGFKNVKIIDANTIARFIDFKIIYNNELKKLIKNENWGNFEMIANDVLMNHLMAHINMKDKKDYNTFLRRLIEIYFFTVLSESEIDLLTAYVTNFWVDYNSWIKSILAKERPAVLGVSTYSTNFAAAYYTLKEAKEFDNSIYTIMGGGIFADQLNENSDNFRYFCDNTNFIDAILIGEGESLLLELLDGKLPSKKYYTLADIDYTPFDLDSVYLPDYYDLNIENYIYLGAYSSRSCYYQCSFCSETVQWGIYRKKTPKKMVEELLQLQKIYNKNLFMFGDSLINANIQELSVEIVKEGCKIYWDSYIRVDKSTCDYELVRFWRKAGFYRARLGIESGSKKVLKMMNKKIDVNVIKKTLRNMAQAGIKTTTYWVVGHPGETEEDFQDSLNLLTACKNYIYEAECHPFYFYPSGQVESSSWQTDNGFYGMFMEEHRYLYISQSYVLNALPSRDEIYNRVQRFAQHCEVLGIPNPYSMYEIYNADIRWKKLHKLSVPPLVDLLT